MSRERARRRAEREAAQAAEKARRRRAAARRRVLTRLATAVRRPRRRPAPVSRLAVQRRRQDGALLAVLVAGHVAVWLSSGSWGLRLGALVLTVLAWPVLVTVLFDRRSRL